ncbi:hypothetical protein ACOMHN_020692 [Nucella lapillus]
MQCSKVSSGLQRDLNDQEQHSRQWNLRVYGVKENQGESAEGCVQKCMEVFSNKVGVTVRTDDIDIAHRAGKPGGSRPRPILARFCSRRLRSQVLADRKQLKQTGVSVGEDLTFANYRLLKRASDHSASLAAWSANGKILTKLKNGATVRVDINTNIDEEFAKAMKGVPKK